MASQRLVSTSFWRDSYVFDLSHNEKLLFLYLLTNSSTNLAGIYEVDLRHVAYETGIELDEVKRSIQKFAIDGKLYYEKNWIVLTNFIKHQRLNPSMKKGINKIIQELPEWLKTRLNPVEHDNQLSMLVSDSPQTVPSLLDFEDNRGSTQTGDSVEQTGHNIIKLNLIKSNSIQSNADKPQDLKKSYRKAVVADEQQAERASNARSRKPSSEKPTQLFRSTERNYR